MKKFVRYIALASLLAGGVLAADPSIATLASQVKSTEDQKLAAGIFIMDNAGMILGCARKNAPTQFGLPGGKHEIGDNAFQAALRETKEETGVTYEEDQLTPVFVTKDGPFDFVTFVLKDGLLSERPTITPGNGEGVCTWITQFQFVTGAFPHYNALLLMMLPDIYKDHYKDRTWYKELERLGFDQVSKMSNDNIKSLVITTGE